MFGKVNLNPKNKRLIFLNIGALCVFSSNTNSSWKEYIFVWINRVKIIDYDRSTVREASKPKQGIRDSPNLDISLHVH